MKAEHEKEFDGPFIVGEEQLEKICSLLEKYVGDIEIRVDCAGDISYYPESIEALLALDNPKAKEILNLKLDARSREPHQRASVYFEGKRDVSILLEYKIPDDTLVQLDSKISEIISGMHPWYSFICNRYLASTVSFLFLSGIMVWLFMTLVRLFPNKPLSDHIPLIVLDVVGVVFLQITVGKLMIKARNWIFPSAVFLLGQGKTRFEYMEKWRWVVVGLAGSLLVGIILLLLQNLQGPK